MIAEDKLARVEDMIQNDIRRKLRDMTVEHKLPNAVIHENVREQFA